MYAGSELWADRGPLDLKLGWSGFDLERGWAKVQEEGVRVEESYVRRPDGGSNSCGIERLPSGARLVGGHGCQGPCCLTPPSPCHCD
ncbi:hypothetical protein MHYP_G00139960 [Metynnis hypsauchen]